MAPGSMLRAWTPGRGRFAWSLGLEPLKQLQLHVSPARQLCAWQMKPTQSVLVLELAPVPLLARLLMLVLVLVLVLVLMLMLVLVLGPA